MASKCNAKGQTSLLAFEMPSFVFERQNGLWHFEVNFERNLDQEWTHFAMDKKKLKQKFLWTINLSFF